MGEGPYRKGKEVRVEDKQIIDLYWARAETAISETAKKYGRYCHSYSLHNRTLLLNCKKTYQTKICRGGQKIWLKA